MMPGLGAEVASWLAYGHAVQSSKEPTRFGRGAIEGVIAPETANNSKEGGSLLPTVTFGIPGSSTMALMIAGFAILGLPLGPTFLGSHGDIAALIGWSVLWSNLAAVLAFVAVLPLVGRIVYLRIDYLAPIVLAISVAGTVIGQHGWVPMALLLGISVLGTFLIRADWPRAPFLLAFIMGHLAEINLIKTTEVYGWDALTRWPAWILIAILAYLIFRGVRAHKGQPTERFSRGDIVIALVLLAAFLAAGASALGFQVRSAPASARRGHPRLRNGHRDLGCLSARPARGRKQRAVTRSLAIAGQFRAAIADGSVHRDILGCLALRCDFTGCWSCAAAGVRGAGRSDHGRLDLAAVRRVAAPAVVRRAARAARAPAICSRPRHRSTGAAATGRAGDAALASATGTSPGRGLPSASSSLKPSTMPSSTWSRRRARSSSVRRKRGKLGLVLISNTSIRSSTSV